MIPGIAKVPDPRVSFRFFSLSALSFTALALVLPYAGARFPAYLHNPPVLLAVHLFTLGGMTALVMGAMYQLLPVVLETPPPDRRLGEWQFWIYAVGFAVIVWGFWAFDWRWIALGGTLVAASAYFFVWLMGTSLWRGPKFGATGGYIAAGLASLALVVTWGLLLAFNLHYGYFGAAFQKQIAAHLTLGIAGWFGLAIAGYSYRLVQMFYLAYRQPPRALFWLPYALVTTVVALATALILGAGPVLAGSLALLLTLLALVYAGDMLSLLRGRRRRHWDTTLLHLHTAVAWLALAALGGLLALSGLVPALRGSKGWVALALALLGGWVANMGIGLTYKVIPFLVWYMRYSAKAGREKVPGLADLLPRRLPAAGYWLWNLGLLVTVAAVLAGPLTVAAWPAAVVAAGALCYAASAVKVLYL